MSLTPMPMVRFSILRFVSGMLSLSVLLAPVTPAVALGELPTDTTPPTVSLVAAVALSYDEVSISWTTSELATSQVTYDQAHHGYNTQLFLNPTALLSHTAVIVGLSADTTYHFCIIATDLVGNTSNSCGYSIKTQPAPALADTAPPVISGVANLSLGIDDATIAWTTNELSLSSLEYGTTTHYGWHANLSATALLAHTALLTGLSPNTTYYYCIHATDLSDNQTDSCGHSVTTATPLDTRAPVIADVAALSLEPHDATIAWTTDELAVSTLEYGTTLDYGSSAPLSASALLAHTTILTGLQANTTYHYCIHATDTAGNVSGSCGHSFTTAAAVVMLDTNPPTISLISVAPITTVSATVGWTTDEIAGGYVEYGTTIGYGSETVFDTNLALTHEATLTDLSPNTQYHYRIHSRDEAGNTVVSPDETFMTEALPISVAPSDTIPPSIGVSTISSIGSSIATINWTTSELAVSTLEYGSTQSYGSSVTLSTSALLVHDATLTGLSPNTTYYYCIHATDLAGNLASSCGHSFTSSAPPVVQDTTAPVSSLITVSSITDTSASIHWANNEQADSRVQYGTTQNYGEETSIEPESGFAGSASLTDLSPSTTYHFRVQSFDSSGNIGTSLDYTFTTAASAGTSGTSESAAPLISEVGADTIGEMSATINWTTDVLADSLVEYGDSENLGSSLSSADLTTRHSITISGLSADTNYYFRVISKPAGGFTYQATSPLHDLTTLVVPIIVDPPANITAVSPSVSGTTASISFSTDEETLGEVEYGLDASYGSSLASNVRGNSGTISLTNLVPGTYHFRVKVLDTAENIAHSEDHTFTIGSSSSSLAPTQQIGVSTSVGGSGGVNLESVHQGSSSSGTEVSSSAGQTREESAPQGQVGGGNGPVVVAVPAPDLVTAEGAESQIIFSWRNPETPSFAGTVLVKKAEGYPTAPADGDMLYRGSHETFADTSLHNGTTYYYALFSYTADGGYSNATHVSIAPKAGVTQITLNRNAVEEQALAQYHFTRDLRVGDQGLEVVHLQQILNFVLLHESRLTTGYFGPLTKDSLNKFQVQNNLPQTGVVDAATRAVLNSISDGWVVLGAPREVALLDRDLKRGDSGEEVGDLQEFLAFEGSYPEAVISNYFGSLTQNAVRTFQDRFGVTPISGYVGYKTRHTMRTVLGL